MVEWKRLMKMSHTREESEVFGSLKDFGFFSRGKKCINIIWIYQNKQTPLDGLGFALFCHLSLFTFWFLSVGTDATNHDRNLVEHLLEENWWIYGPHFINNPT